MLHTMREVVAATGVTSRALRHRDRLGLLPASGTAAGGERLYDAAALRRLQRLLLLRRTGMPLTRIGEVLDAPHSEADALREHLATLESEQEQLLARIESVRRTVRALEEKEEISMSEMFEGFDHTRHQEEVSARWGAEAYRDSDAWWRAKSAAGKQEFKAELARLQADWIAAARDGQDPAGETAQTLAERHVAWLRSIPGTPASGGTPEQTRQYVLGLAELYVSDERFAANYGGAEQAGFVRDALRAHFGR